MQNIWTHEEVEILQKHYATSNTTEMMRLLNKPARVISAKAFRINLKKNADVIREINSHLTKASQWNENQLDILREKYPNTDSQILVKELGKSLNSIQSQASKLKIKKSAEYLKWAVKEGAKKSNSTFKPGHTPHNKGGKMPPEMYEKMKHTFFTKGFKPHNTKKIGTITLRTENNFTYYWIKISDSNWELYHRHIWEKEYGKIPKGMMIGFIDGNSKNCVIENLEMITLQEMMKRNSIQNIPLALREEIITLKSLNNKLKKLSK